MGNYLMKIERKGGYIISRIQKISSRILSQKLIENGIEISHGQGRLLFILWDNDGLSVQELAKKASLSKSTVSSLLKKLSHGGLVSIEHPPGNNRKKIVSYLENDLDLEQKYSKISNEMNALYYQGFTEVEIEQFEKNLEKLYHNYSRIVLRGPSLQHNFYLP